MLKSDILEKIQQKYKNFNSDDIETLFDIFIKKITASLKEGNNIEEKIRTIEDKSRTKENGG